MSDIDMTSTQAATHDPTRPLEAESSLGELLSRLTADFGDLVSTQVELAKVEIKDEVSHAGKGVGMLSGGGVAGYLAVTLLSFAAAWGLDEVMPTAVAFLIVGVIWLFVAGVLYSAGRKELSTVRVTPQTKASLQEDVQWAKQHKN
jgi:hypothetical protein